MTSKDRLLAAIRHQEPDYVPISPRHIPYVKERYGGTDLPACMAFIDEFGWDQLLWYPVNGCHDYFYFQHRFVDYQDVDVVSVELHLEKDEEKINVRRTITTPAGKLTDRRVHPKPGYTYGLGPNPELVEPLIKTREDIEKMKFLLPDLTDYKVTNLKPAEKIMGDKGIVELRPHRGVDHMLVDSVGIQQAMLLYYDDREMLDEVLRILNEDYEKRLKATIDAKPLVIFESWYNSSLSTGWSPEAWRELFKPYIKRHSEMVRDAGIYFHFYDDGKVMSILDDIADIEPDIFSTLCPPPLADVDLKAVKEKLGRKTCLMGYIDLLIIKQGTPEEVTEQVRYAISTAAKGGGYILGTNDAIREGTPLENVQALYKAGREFGKYPIKV